MIGPNLVSIKGAWIDPDISQTPLFRSERVTNIKMCAYIYNKVVLTLIHVDP